MAGSRTLKLSILADVDDLKKKLDTGSKEVEGFGGKLGEFGKKAAAAFAVAGAAAAAYAGKLLVEGVKSAIEDEKAQAKLATTLQNVAGATNAQIAATEEYITKTSLAFGVTDDKLRPSLERLTIATGDVTEAQKLQKLALDVAAGSGKELDTVSQALAKAYEGNTSALGRLGVGLSAAELKTMSFDEVTAALATTFKDQATIQSETLEGRMTRLSVAFDEAKESVGARLLPIITSFLTFVTDKLIPGAENIVAKFKPITKAIDDNKDSFKALYDFAKDFLIPFLGGAFKLGINGVVTVITTLVNIVGKAVSGFQWLLDKAKAFVEWLKNNPLAKLLGNLNPFGNASFSTSNASFVQAGGVTETQGNFTNPFAPGIPFMPTQRYLDEVAETERLKEETAAIRERIRARKEGISTDGITETIVINVNSASIIDEEGFTRSVINALNSSEARTGSLGTLNI